MWFSEDAIRKLDDQTVEPMVAPSAGVHVILPGTLFS